MIYHWKHIYLSTFLGARKSNNKQTGCGKGLLDDSKTTMVEEICPFTVTLVTPELRSLPPSKFWFEPLWHTKKTLVMYLNHRFLFPSPPELTPFLVTVMKYLPGNLTRPGLLHMSCYVRVGVITAEWGSSSASTGKWCLTCFLLFFQSRTPDHEMLLAALRWDFPSHGNFTGRSVIDTILCLYGDSKS